MNEIKYVGTCPCGRGIERGDDIVERKGVAYHDGCEPEDEPVAIPSQPGSPVVSDPPRGAQDAMEKLLSLVTTLTKKVADLEATAKEASAGRSPQMSFVAAPKKSKAEKGAPRPDVYYIIKGYASEAAKVQPQYMKVSRAIAQAAPEGGKMTEMDVWNALMDAPHPSEKPSKSVGSWNYRQTPFYIFKYYRAAMINAEYVLGPFSL